MMIIGSRMVSLWFKSEGIEATPDAYLQGSPIDRTIFSVLIVAGLLILLRRRLPWSLILRRNIWVFLFFLYCGISVLWAEFPEVSFKRWIKAIGNPIMVLVVLTDLDPIEALKTIFRRCTYLLIPLSVLLIKYYPHLGRSYHRYTGTVQALGVTTTKNTLGLLSLIAGLYLCWSLLKMWHDRRISVDKKEFFIYIILLLMIAWLFQVTNSATSLMCFIIGICVLILFDTQVFKKRAHLIARYILLLSALLFPVILLSYEFILSAAVNVTGHSTTFWGRVDMWSALIDMMDSPLIGTGYGSFWLGDRLSQLWANYWWHPTGSHNGYVEIYLELGLIGLFFLMGILIAAYRNISQVLMSDFNYGTFLMVLLLTTLLYNVTETAFGTLNLIWFVFLLTAIEMPRLAYQNQRY